MHTHLVDVRSCVCVCVVRPHDPGYEALVRNKRKPTAWQRLFDSYFCLLCISEIHWEENKLSVRVPYNSYSKLHSGQSEQPMGDIEGRKYTIWWKDANHKIQMVSFAPIELPITDYKNSILSYRAEHGQMVMAQQLLTSASNINLLYWMFTVYCVRTRRN